MGAPGPATHLSTKALSSIAVMSGRFSLSLYVGSRTLYLFLVDTARDDDDGDCDPFRVGVAARAGILHGRAQTEENSRAGLGYEGQLRERAMQSRDI